MGKQLDIEEVLTFSESLELKEAGFLQLFKSFIIRSNSEASSFEVILLGSMFLVVFSLLLLILAMKFREGSFLENLISGTVILLMLVAGGVTAMKNNEFALLTPESQQEYQSMENKWMREFALPYVEQLPLESVVDIAKVEYDYDLETTTSAPPRHQMPIKVTTTQGETYSLWAKVVELKEDVPSILTFTRLHQDIVFHEYAEVAFPKGYHNGTIYTSADI